jgi:hypothetical protein
VRFPATGEYGGIYVWDTKESLEAWTAGKLAETLAETYQVEGDPVRELAERTSGAGRSRNRDRPDRSLLVGRP